MRTISVIIPVYNAEKWIEETLNSLVSQTFSALEIICVDDGSMDESCSIIEGMQKDHANIRLIKQKNAGVCVARNVGIEAANGEYIAFLDADDYVDADMYNKMIAQLEQEASDIVFCEFVRFWPNGKVQYTVEESFDALCKNTQDIRYFLQSTTSYVDRDTLHTKDIHGCVWRSVFRKSLIQNHNIRFNPKLKFAEDQIFVLQYLHFCDKISYLPDAMIHYRGHTKPWIYHDMYQNQMELLNQQIEIVTENKFYSETDKKQLIGYLKCSTYFSVINQELMFKEDADQKLKQLNSRQEFKELLTFYNFIQKYKVRSESKRIILYILLKLQLWKIIRAIYPNKKY